MGSLQLVLELGRLACWLAQGDVGAANVVVRVDRVEGDGCVGVGGEFGQGALEVFAASLEAIDEAKDSGDGHSRLAGGLDGGDGGAAGCADVVHDDDGRARGEEAFDAATGAVSFFGFADEES